MSDSLVNRFGWIRSFKSVNSSGLCWIIHSRFGSHVHEWIGRWVTNYISVCLVNMHKAINLRNLEKQYNITPFWSLKASVSIAIALKNAPRIVSFCVQLKKLDVLRDSFYFCMQHDPMVEEWFVGGLWVFRLRLRLAPGLLSSETVKLNIWNRV